jgi:methyltransferase (TIGR00027 family)
METGLPSRTALAAAAHRAAHQLLEHGRIFADPLALKILGPEAVALARESSDRPHSRGMRLYIAARTRMAEDALEDAVAAGTRQLVVLGAGLDTYAYRGAARDRLRIFEVDHPATQAWKRERLNESGIALPPALTFAPGDFERQTLAEVLSRAGHDPAIPTFFTWLGVVPYLAIDTVWSTLECIASSQARVHAVFDYMEPADSLSPGAQAVRAERAARVAALGEAWVSQFQPHALAAGLAAIGLTVVEDLGPRELMQRYLREASAPFPEKGGHVLHAVRA